MDGKKSELSVIEKLIGLKIPLGMVISELSFYEGMLELTLKKEKTLAEVPEKYAMEVLQSIDTAMELLASVRKKLQNCLPEESQRDIKKNSKRQGYFVTVSYIKKRNYFCLLYRTRYSFGTLSRVLKRKDPLSYQVLREMRDSTFSHWSAMAGRARAELTRRIQSLPRSCMREVISEFEQLKEIELLKTVDTMRFPNETIFRQRLFTLVKTLVGKTLSDLNRHPRPLLYRDDDSPSEEEWLTISRRELDPDQEDQNPLDLVLKKEEQIPDITFLMQRFVEAGLTEEAEYLRRFKNVVERGGRLNKYEIKKLKGSVKFFLFSILGGEK